MVVGLLLKMEKGICSTCGYNHHQENDGYDYLDCMLYYREYLEPKNIKEARESKVEVWNKNTKVWTKRNAL